MKKISKTLYLRGMHRSFGNPAIGTFTGFLTVLFLIRTTVNLYFVFDLNRAGSALSSAQMTISFFIYLSAFAILVGPLALLHIVFALPELSFIDLSPGRDGFRAEFFKRAILVRPMNVVTAALLIIAAFIFGMAGAGMLTVIVMAFSVLCSAALSYFIIIRIMAWTSLGLPEIQGLELLYLIIIVMLNPDISNLDGNIFLLFRGVPFLFDSAGSAAAALGFLLILSVLIIVLFKAANVISSLFKGRISVSVIESWYWRFFKARFWIYIYFLLFPVIILPVFPEKVKLWSLVIFLIFGTMSYLYFIAQCENLLTTQWRQSLLTKKNRRLFRRSLVSHIILMLIPAAGFYLLRL